MYRFFPLKVGLVPAAPAPAIYYMHDFGEMVQVPYYFWYLEGHGHRILVDVGFEIEEGLTVDPGLTQEDEWRPLNRLAQLGVEPESIDTVILTHAHYDHLSSCILYYPNATFYMQVKEMRYALRPSHPWFNRFYILPMCEKLNTEWRDRLRLIDGEAEILPGLRVLRTGGHTPGHQSLIFESAKGRTGMAADIAFMYRHLEEDIAVGLHCNIEEVLLGMARLRGECDLVLPGHDPLLEEQFPIEKLH